MRSFWVLWMGVALAGCASPPKVGGRDLREDPPEASEPSRKVDPHAHLPHPLHELSGADLGSVAQRFLDRTGSPGLSLDLGEGRVERFGAVDAHAQLGPVGELSRSVTWLAVLQAESDGALHQDDPVGWYDASAYDVLYPSNGGPTLTVRHLVDQTAGLPNQSFDEPLASSDVLARLRGVALGSAPGRRFAPSNLSYAVLEALIEKTTGKPFEQYAEERVLGPLRSPGAAPDVSPPRDGLRGVRLAEGSPALPDSLTMSFSDLTTVAAALRAVPDRGGPFEDRNEEALRYRVLVGTTSERTSAIVLFPDHGVSWALMAAGRVPMEWLIETLVQAKASAPRISEELTDAALRLGELRRRWDDEVFSKLLSKTVQLEHPSSSVDWKMDLGECETPRALSAVDRYRGTFEVRCERGALKLSLEVFAGKIERLGMTVSTWPGSRPVLNASGS